MTAVGRTLLLAAGLLLGVTTAAQEIVARHEILVNHPAFEQEKPSPFVLAELREDGRPVFFLEVKSVICADHLCKVVPVGMYWDDYGRYLRYTLAGGVYLEKGEGEAFAAEDYAILDTILRDADSPYRGLSYHEVTHEGVVGEGAADGISGATTLILRRGQTVVGATWSCFTLWHWAQGDVGGEIRRITGARQPLPALLALLRSDEVADRRYALGEILRRRHTSAAVTAALTECIDQKTDGEAELIVAYLDRLLEDRFLKALEDIFTGGGRPWRLRMLEMLARANRTVPPTTLLALLDALPAAAGYPEVDKLLGLAEATPDLSGKEVARRLLPWLSVDDFLVSRRVYYFLYRLGDQAPVEAQLAAYRARYGDRL